MDGGEVVEGKGAAGVPQPPVGEGHGRVDHDRRHAQQLRHAGPGHGEGAGRAGSRCTQEWARMERRVWPSRWWAGLLSREVSSTASLLLIGSVQKL